MKKMAVKDEAATKKEARRRRRRCGGSDEIGRRRRSRQRVGRGGREVRDGRRLDGRPRKAQHLR